MNLTRRVWTVLAVLLAGAGAAAGQVMIDGDAPGAVHSPLLGPRPDGAVIAAQTAEPFGVLVPAAPDLAPAKGAIVSTVYRLADGADMDEAALTLMTVFAGQGGATDFECVRDDCVAAGLDLRVFASAVGEGGPSLTQTRYALARWRTSSEQITAQMYAGADADGAAWLRVDTARAPRGDLDVGQEISLAIAEAIAELRTDAPPDQARAETLLAAAVVAPVDMSPAPDGDDGRPPAAAIADGANSGLAENILKALSEDGAANIYGISFASGSAAIAPGSDPALREIAAALNAAPDVNLVIVGHTDLAGPLDYNVVLSQRRAEAVRAALTTDYGVAPQRLETRGVGFLAPVSTNATPEGRARNRRVALVAR